MSAQLKGAPGYGFALAPIKQEGTLIWIGDYGAYTVPAALRVTTPWTKKGRPDKRHRADYKRFMDWVKQQEQLAKDNLNG